MHTRVDAVIATTRRLVRLVSAHGLVLLCGWCAAQATTIGVDATADDTTVNGNCTLREAVIAANTDAAVDLCPAGNGADVITVPAGTYLLTLVGAGEDAAATGDLDVTADVELEGAGAASTIVDGNLADRVFDVDPAAGGITAQVSAITVRNGDQVSGGGGIRNAGNLTLADSTVTSNRTSSVTRPQGGGIRSSGNLTVILSTVADNTAELLDSANQGLYAEGGGIYSDGSAVITASTIDGNMAIAGQSSSVAGAAGGGIYAVGSLSISTSTISNNTASAALNHDAFGGGIHIIGAGLTLANSTISGNVARMVGMAPFGTGGGLFVASGTAAISNCTIVENLKIIELGGDDSGHGMVVAGATLRNTIVDHCETSGTVIANAYNLLEGVNDCNFFGTDLVGVDPLLGPLQDNGGPTFTHALLPASPAIDAGNPAMPGIGGAACDVTDQRDVSRPQRARCDIGSVEIGPCPTTPLAGCDIPAKSRLLIKDRDADGAGTADELIWKWLQGPATLQADFGNPTTTANYTLCLYAGTTLALAAWVPADRTCGNAACWTALGSRGYRRSDLAAGADGVARIILKGGASAKIIVKGKGSNLDLDADTLPLAGMADVLVQLSNSDNASCWQSTFPAASVTKNSDTLFKAKTP